MIFSVIVIAYAASGERRFGIRDNILSGTSNVLAKRIAGWRPARERGGRQ